jgi:hypothetical protein
MGRFAKIGLGIWMIVYGVAGIVPMSIGIILAVAAIVIGVLILIDK